MLQLIDIQYDKTMDYFRYRQPFVSFYRIFVYNILKIEGMKIIVDDKIPYISEAIQSIADKVVYAPGKEFTPELVKDADALIIRTRTFCDKSLLEGSQVKFIATATIGFDHIDTAYCKEAGIAWANAPGCNASSVAQYIESIFLLLKLEEEKTLTDLTIGVVGVGNVGSKIVALAQSYGMRVLQCDPPRQDAEKDDSFCSLQTIAEQCDIITFHTPLNKEGKYETYHMADADFFASLKRKPYIINTSRGEVIATEALLDAINKELIEEAIIDVWEFEPDIDRELLSKVWIGTPHIAGYSADGKANATRMSLDAICRFFNIKATYSVMPPAPPYPIVEAPSLDEALLMIYDPRNDSEQLETQPDKFEELRGNYPLRREKEAYTIIVE